MVPPIMSMMFLEMASPRPVPWMPLTVALCSLVNGSKMCFWNSSVMPMPLSRTLNSKRARPASLPGFSLRRSSIVPPGCVNFTALLSRLSSTCCRRRWSQTTVSCTTPCMSTRKVSRRAAALAWMMVRTSCTMSDSLVGHCAMTTLPLSMRLMSSTSLMSDSRWLLDTEIFSR